MGRSIGRLLLPVNGYVHPRIDINCLKASLCPLQRDFNKEVQMIRPMRRFPCASFAQRAALDPGEEPRETDSPLVWSFRLSSISAQEPLSRR